MIEPAHNFLLSGLVDIFSRSSNENVSRRSSETKESGRGVRVWLSERECVCACVE